MGLADVDELGKVDLALLFARLDRIAAAIRASNNALFDSGGAPDVYEERRALRDALAAIDAELQRRSWPATDPSIGASWDTGGPLP